MSVAPRTPHSTLSSFTHSLSHMRLSGDRASASSDASELMSVLGYSQRRGDSFKPHHTTATAPRNAHASPPRRQQPQTTTATTAATGGMPQGSVPATLVPPQLHIVEESPTAPPPHVQAAYHSTLDGEAWLMLMCVTLTAGMRSLVTHAYHVMETTTTSTEGSGRWRTVTFPPKHSATRRDVQVLEEWLASNLKVQLWLLQQPVEHCLLTSWPPLSAGCKTASTAHSTASYCSSCSCSARLCGHE